jgi:FKBP-type peptidyl-prolyl cis-trans isomerase FkpA
MKKYILFALVLGLAFTQYSCEDNSIKAEREEIRQYLADNNKLDGAIETEEGVFVYLSDPGIGTETPSATSTVNVKYRGWLLEDGTEFDNSFGNTVQYNLTTSQIIQGWKIGLQEFPEDSKGEMYIPSALAYGEFDWNGIPGGSILVFEIEMVDFF